MTHDVFVIQLEYRHADMPPDYVARTYDGNFMFVRSLADAAYFRTAEDAESLLTRREDGTLMGRADLKVARYSADVVGSVRMFRALDKQA